MKTAVLTALMATILALPMANAQPWAGGKMAEQLKLTDQQTKQLQDLRFQQQKAMIPKRADLKLAQLDLKQSMMNPKVDERAALAKLDKVSSIKAEIAKMKLQNMLAMRKVLTDEQLSTWMKMRHEMGMRGKRGMRDRGEMGPMMHHMMGPGPGMGMEHPSEEGK